MSSSRAPDAVPAGVELRVERFARCCRSVATRLPHLGHDRRVTLLIEALRQTPADCRTRDGRALVAALVAELASRVLQETARERGASTAPARIDAVGGAVTPPHVSEALDEMRRRAGDPAITLHAIAGSVGVSRWHLSRLLRAGTGQSFLGLLAALRTQRAKALLVETRLSIKEVSARCGYDHVSQFDRQFRRLSGLTPGRYRALWQVRPTPPTPPRRGTSGHERGVS